MKEFFSAEMLPKGWGRHQLNKMFFPYHETVLSQKKKYILFQRGSIVSFYTPSLYEHVRHEQGVLGVARQRSEERRRR